jgi:hypothetical protein
MPRKLTDIAHVNVRIREGLRRKLEADAKRRRISLNGLVTVLLETALLDKPYGDIWEIAREIKGEWMRLGANQEFVALWDVVAEELKRGGSAEEVAERVKVLVAGPVAKGCAILELLRQQDRDDRLSPSERLLP